MGYLVGVDIGGTFTDCIVVADDGQVTIGKAPSTGPDFEAGFIDSIAAAAEHLGLNAERLIEDTEAVYHGCTVGTNALIEGRTARTGLLTTRGHGDTLSIMRGGQRLWNQSPDYVAHLANHDKDEILIPRTLTEEVDERIAFDGQAVVELDEDGARESIQRLVDAGVTAVAVSCIWSVANDAHERRIAELIREMAPEVFVSVASEVVKRTGEYERTVATVINALIGSVVQDYLARLEQRLEGLAYTSTLQIMTCTGGVVAAEEARERPILTMHSGPVGGLIGAGTLAKLSRSEGSSGPAASANGRARNGHGPPRGDDIITADMGGTTLDVGVLRHGQPIQRPTSWHGQYEYFVPTLDVQSIGAGGGSIVRYDEALGTLRVGPQSAGAKPGPACYGRGGELATVTDADLVMGYLDPERFLGGNMRLEEGLARRALAGAGAAVGFGDEETARAAVRIVESQMADAIRLASVQQGYDPRHFSLYAYGGAGPLHGAALARELGIARVVIPLSDLASGWSAFGVASADIVVAEDLAVGLTTPLDAVELAELWQRVEEPALARMSQQGVAEGDVIVERAAEMRFRGQVNEVEVPAPGGAFDEGQVGQLLASFEREYDRLFGEGTGYAAAGIAITRLIVRARATADEFSLGARAEQGASDLQPRTERGVLFPADPDRVTVPIYTGGEISSGSWVEGPVIVEFPDTSVVVPPDSRAGVDELGSVVIELR